MTKDIILKRSSEGQAEIGVNKIKPVQTAHGWNFSKEERADMAKAFSQLYAETESLLGSHMHNFETLQ